jgi:tetratricopeptide (TPR) repeat protein
VSDYHVFISYARKDNEPKGKDGKGWVDALAHDLAAFHVEDRRPKLNIFFDNDRIENGDFWSSKIREGLRQSRLFLAVLSPNFFASDWCRKEVEEYLRIEHAKARGVGGIRPIYFATMPGFDDDQAPAHLKQLIEQLNSRNRTSPLDLRDWSMESRQALAEMDAAARLSELKAAPSGPTSTYTQTIHSLDKVISQRLDTISMAEMNPNLGNLSASYSHFVGRAAEMAALHDGLVGNEVHLLTAVHGMGGLGKSALARQYGHAYAGHYAAGGRWEVSCEDKTNLAEVFDTLSIVISGQNKNDARFANLRLSDAEQRLEDRDRMALHISRLKHFTCEGWAERVSAWRNNHGQLHTNSEREFGIPASRILVILDNLNKPELLNAELLAALGRNPWLEVIVTSRFRPDEIADSASLKALVVPPLPINDAVALLYDFRNFTNSYGHDPREEEEAAYQIAEVLDGFTLAVELVGGYLRSNPTISMRNYFEGLKERGLTSTDDHLEDADVSSQIRHKIKSVGLIVDQTLSQLKKVERDILHLATYFSLDGIPSDWLRTVAAANHPQINKPTPKGHRELWSCAIATLKGQQLLVTTVDENNGRATKGFRVHRIVAEHIQKWSDQEINTQNRELVIAFATGMAGSCEHPETGWNVNQGLLILLSPLLKLCEALLNNGEYDPRLARQLGVCAEGLFQYDDMSSAGPLFVRRNQLDQRWAETHPLDERAARDLAVSQSMLGEFYLRRGCVEQNEVFELLVSSATSLNGLLQNDPNNQSLMRELAIAESNLADFYCNYVEPSDFDAAIKQAIASHELFERLLSINQEGIRELRDLWVIKNKLGALYLNRGIDGDLSLASKHQDGGISLAIKLHNKSPNSYQAARDVAIARSALGDVYIEASKFDTQASTEALQHLISSATEMLEVYSRNPNGLRALRDLSITLLKLGDFFTNRNAQGDIELAKSNFEQCLKLRQRLLDADSDNPVAIRELAEILESLANLLSADGDAQDLHAAHDYADRAFPLRLQLYKLSPNSKRVLRELWEAALLLFLISIQKTGVPIQNAEFDQFSKVTRWYVNSGHVMDTAMAEVVATLTFQT